MIVSVQGLRKVYKGAKDIVAVDGIDLSVGEGEIFGLLGPNGAGKTTTISIATTRALPTAGRVLIAGIDVVESPALARQQIGVVPQYNTLDRACTVFENLYFHCLYFGFSRPEAKARATALLEQFHLTERGECTATAAVGRPRAAGADCQSNRAPAKGPVSRRAECGTRSAEPNCHVGCSAGAQS